MPEETNRIIADHVSDWLFAPTAGAQKILRKEGLPASKIFMTGNTIVDAVHQNLRLSGGRAVAARLLPRGKKEYFLLTLHRQENVDFKDRFNKILDGLNLIGRHFGLPILFPIHPRTHQKLKALDRPLPACIHPVPPVGFLDFLALERSARMLLTDSGGVQEEGCILGVPCLTFRTTTERPETLEAGSNALAGIDPQQMLQRAKRMDAVRRNWKNPFGDGRSAERIVRIVRTKL
jgi:UDP-N-acetylglucosamine 2-epimerase (non-hydrolysing)